MFRKSAVLAAGGYRHFPLFEDYYLWIRMLMNLSLIHIYVYKRQMVQDDILRCEKHTQIFYGEKYIDFPFQKNIHHKRSENYSQWYNDLVVKADLAEQSAVRGCMVIKTVTAYQQYGFSSPEELDEACSAAYAAMQESLTEQKQVEDVYKRQPQQDSRRGKMSEKRILAPR